MPFSAVGLLSVGPLRVCTILGRVNRFTVAVEAASGRAGAYLDNTGRLADVLLPGRRGFCLERSGGKLPYQLLAVEAPELGGVVVLSTRLHMEAVERAAELGLIPGLRGCRLERRNPRFEDSVLDYLYNCGDTMALVEVKSAVMLLEGLWAGYPDPPSARGRRHIQTLARASRRGYRALLIFAASIPAARGVRVYWEADPKLPQLLHQSEEAGVIITAVNITGEVLAGKLHIGIEPGLPVAF